jgi:cytochrome P450
VRKTNIFISKLDALAGTGEDFDMDPLCTSLTFDIIGEVVCNLDFKAQDNHGDALDIVKYFRALISTWTDTGRVWNWANIPKRITRIIMSYRTDEAIKKCIREKFEEIKAAQSTETKQTKDRSVLALSLQETDVLTPEILQSTADQVKTFLFAGHDTTSILLQRLFYALSTHPKCLATLRAEHDTVFGEEDPQDVFLARPEECMNSLMYTLACIKGALRLWPPAATARMARPGSGFKVRLEDGSEVLLDGLVLYLNHHLIQRDPKVYGETASDFVPERWLDDADTSSAQKEEVESQTRANKIPIR